MGRRYFGESPISNPFEDGVIKNLDKAKGTRKKNIPRDQFKDLPPSTELYAPKQLPEAEILERQKRSALRAVREEPKQELSAGSPLNVQKSIDRPEPRDDIWDPSLAQKRYPSKARKSLDAQVRRARKGRLDQISA